MYKFVDDSIMETIPMCPIDCGFKVCCRYQSNVPAFSGVRLRQPFTQKGNFLRVFFLRAANIFGYVF